MLFIDRPAISHKVEEVVSQICALRRRNTDEIAFLYLYVYMYVCIFAWFKHKKGKRKV